VPQNLVQPPPIQRVIMNRHQSRRSGSSIAPKIESVVSPLPPPVHSHSTTASPKSRPTPSSHTNSPTNPPAFGSQSAVSPAGSDQVSMRAGMPPGLKQQLSPVGPINPARAQMMQAGHGIRPTAAAPFYPTSGFQNHISELGKLPRFLPFIELCSS
jgi:hypothetical protein